MKVVLAGAVLAAVSIGAAGCGGSKSDKTVHLVAYSTPKEAYASLIPAFNKTEAGKGIEFAESYGASGDQSRAVVGGAPADVVTFSLEPDMKRLVDKGLVASDWNKDGTKGDITDSVVVFLVRKGNPNGIKTWDDLIKPDVKVLNPNPFISGGARWNVMAAYGAQIKSGKAPDEAKAYLTALFKNISIQPKSARDMLQAFTGGEGDVALAYENEAITAQQKGQDVDYVVPDQTILIQNPIAVVKDAKAGKAASDFVAFLRTPAAQRIFAEKGYRPVDKAVLAEFKNFPTPSGLFTIDDVGGWSAVMKTFFDKDAGVIAGIEKGLGVSTSG